jgi:hypothetical protein
VVGAVVGAEVGVEVGAVVGVEAELLALVGVLLVGADVGPEEVDADDEGAVGLVLLDDGLLCRTGDGWCPRAGVTGFGETTWWPAGASRMAATTTVPAAASAPAAVIVAGRAPKRRNSVRRRSASSPGRTARWAPRLFSGADTKAAGGQTSSTAVT